ncbi:MAG: hypothetical protein KBT39_11075 [Bacteroidales bacterium]|nr:hypothetical protein [Bacteroidales bacterium]
MKKEYIKPMSRIFHSDHQDIICQSPYGPNSEGIPFEGEGGDEEIYCPSRAKGLWYEW